MSAAVIPLAYAVRPAVVVQLAYVPHASFENARANFGFVSMQNVNTRPFLQWYIREGIVPTAIEFPTVPITAAVALVKRVVMKDIAKHGEEFERRYR